MSGESELLEVAQLHCPRRKHGWSKETEKVVFLPSGGVTGPVSAIVVQRPLLASQVANFVVLRPEETGLNATSVQVGMNALDKLVARSGADVSFQASTIGQVSVSAAERKRGQAKSDQVGLRSGGTSKQGGGVQVCSRTGLPKSRLRKDWPCPNGSCTNSSKLVFGKHDKCPLCGALRSVLDQGPSGPAMDRSTRPRSPVREERLEKQRRLLESIEAKQRKAQKGGDREAQATKPDESSNESAMGPEVNPPIRPIFGQDWRPSSSTERSVQSGPVGFTPRKREQYMLEGGRSFGAGDGQVFFPSTLIDSTIGYGSGDLAQDNGPMSAGRCSGQEDVVRDFEDCSQFVSPPFRFPGSEEEVSPTVPFSLCQGDVVRGGSEPQVLALQSGRVEASLFCTGSDGCFRFEEVCSLVEFSLIGARVIWFGWVLLGSLVV